MTDTALFLPFAEEVIAAYLPCKDWTFRFDNARRRGGQAQLSNRRITMSRLLVPLWSDDQCLQTLLHEIAHALAFERGVYERGARSHGTEWLEMARDIGYRGGRTHSNPTLASRRSQGLQARRVEDLDGRPWTLIADPRRPVRQVTFRSDGLILSLPSGHQLLSESRALPTRLLERMSVSTCPHTHPITVIARGSELDSLTCWHCGRHLSTTVNSRAVIGTVDSTVSPS